MIIFIEGPRCCGKTFLLDKYFEQNNDPRIQYYKFYFANWVKKLKLQGLDNDPSLHYLSLGNILTILEQMKGVKDKILVFDRAILSAYTWAKLRKRLSTSTTLFEINEILGSEYYQNCKTIFIEPHSHQTKDLDRDKDFWDGSHTTIEEKSAFESIIAETMQHLKDDDRENEYKLIYNDFSEYSIDLFCGILNSYLNSL